MIIATALLHVATLARAYPIADDAGTGKAPATNPATAGISSFLMRIFFQYLFIFINYDTYPNKPKSFLVASIYPADAIKSPVLKSVNCFLSVSSN